MKAKEIILMFLRQFDNGQEFGNYQIQIELPKYGQIFYGKLYSPDSYSRAWRELREERRDLTMAGIGLTEFMKPESKVKYFRVTRA